MNRIQNSTWCTCLLVVKAELNSAADTTAFLQLRTDPGTPVQFQLCSSQLLIFEDTELSLRQVSRIVFSSSGRMGVWTWLTAFTKQPQYALPLHDAPSTDEPIVSDVHRLRPTWLSSVTSISLRDGLWTLVSDCCLSAYSLVQAPCFADSQQGKDRRTLLRAWSLAI